MSTQQAADAAKNAVQSVADGVKNLTTSDGNPAPNSILDEATGEYVSKTELKRRQKLREKEAKKKDKEAAAPPKAAKKTSAEDEEANLTPNVSGPNSIFPNIPLTPT